MTVSVFIDNNVWDLLFKYQFDLLTELPRPEFSLGITTEAEFELNALAKVGKNDLLAFIEKVKQQAEIEVDAYFGFADESLPLEEQRVGGFDCGRFIGDKEQEFITAQQQKQRPSYSKLNQTTRLYKQEADISIAARSFDCVVLSADSKAGPIKDAYLQGGKVVFIDAVADPKTQNIRNRVREAFNGACANQSKDA